VKEIADESNSEQARQMACVICKNLIVASAAVSIPQGDKMRQNITWKWKPCLIRLLTNCVVT